MRAISVMCDTPAYFQAMEMVKEYQHNDNFIVTVKYDRELHGFDGRPVDWCFINVTEKMKCQRF